MRPVTIYLTESRELLIFGLCDDCDQRVQIQDSIATLFKMACAISKDGRKPIQPPLKALPLQTDANFLKSMGVQDDEPRDEVH